MDASRRHRPGQHEALFAAPLRLFLILFLVSVVGASTGCGPRRHVVIDRADLAQPASTPVLDEMLVLAMERAVEGLALDVLAEEEVFLVVQSRDVAMSHRLRVMFEARLKELSAESLTPLDDRSATIVRLVVSASGLGTQLIHDRDSGWSVEATCTLAARIEAPSLQWISDRSVGREIREVRLSHGGVWFPDAP